MDELTLNPIHPLNRQSLPESLERLGRGAKLDPARRAEAVQVAKDFESVLIHRMLKAMKDTIPESGLLSSGTTKQVQDMFYGFLAEEVADQGGMGLWKRIYEQTTGEPAPDAAAVVETLK